MQKKIGKKLERKIGNQKIGKKSEEKLEKNWKKNWKKNQKRNWKKNWKKNSPRPDSMCLHHAAAASIESPVSPIMPHYAPRLDRPTHFFRRSISKFGRKNFNFFSRGPYLRLPVDISPHNKTTLHQVHFVPFRQIQHLKCPILSQNHFQLKDHWWILTVLHWKR